MSLNSSSDTTNLQSLSKKLYTGSNLELSPALTSPLNLSQYTGGSSSLIFIDAYIDNYDSLVAGIKPGTEVHILNPLKDAVAQITDALSGRQGISSLQIISHGSVGSLDFASSSLSTHNIRSYINELQTWGKALTSDGDILLYGCNVAAGETGVNFVRQLSQLTGADVAASNDLTGSSNKGGNWVLETATGLIESSSALQLATMASYNSVFNSPVAIINEFSQGSTGAKEWVEILVVQDNLNLQNYRLVDGSSSNSLNIQLSGSGFNELKAGTLIVLYNGGDVDSAITPDLNYDPTKGDYSLQISSLNNTGNFAVTRNNGWNSTTGAFDNSSSTDIPRLLDATGNEIYKFPKNPTPAGLQVLSVAPFRALPGRATGFIGNTAIGATQATNWSIDYYSAAGNPGLANGDKNTAWINLLRGNVSPTYNNSTNVTLPSINEDAPSTDNQGVFISDLIQGQISDINNNIRGIAVTDVIGNGNWQYSLNGGANWSNFGQVSDTSATVLTGLVSLYNGGANNTPENQGWLQYGASPPVSAFNINIPVGGNQTASGGATTLISTESGSAGYSNYSGGFASLLNPAFPTLDRNQGFTLSFDIKINSESHASDNTRAGFSVILVTSDKTKAIELGFWQDRIFAQNPTFTGSTESVARNTTTALTRYDLKVQADIYQLFAAGETTAILTGSLRDYTEFDHNTAGQFSTPLPYDPYEQANFIFLGDNTSRASANVSLARVELMSNTKIRFAPIANYNGDATVKFRAWDRTDGSTAGSFGVNTTSSNAFSSTSKVASITVKPTPEWQLEATTDFSGDGKQDILQRDSETGSVRVWYLQTNNIGDTLTMPTMEANWKIAKTADFNKDGKVDIFWRNTNTGENRVWLMNNTSTPDVQNVMTLSTAFRPEVEAIADFDGDGNVDIFWRNNDSGTGWNAIWKMSGTVFKDFIALPTVADTNTKIAAVVDFDRDGKLDILWRNSTTGENAIWKMNGVNYGSFVSLPGVVGASIEFVGNLDSDADVEIFWRNSTTGENAIWNMNGANYGDFLSLPGVLSSTTSIKAVADFDGDGKLDIFWHDRATGWNSIWKMDGTLYASHIAIRTQSNLSFDVKAIKDFDGDGDVDIVWYNSTTSATSIWRLQATMFADELLIN